MKRTKSRKKIPKGYDSRFEYELHNNELKGLSYHPEKISYVTESTYEPDFFYQVRLGKGRKGSQDRCQRVLVEVKGRFRDRKEATKYIYVRKALKENEELIFLFQDSAKPMPGAQKRKNGTKQTHGEWADKNGFSYVCYKEGVPKWLIECSLPPKRVVL